MLSKTDENAESKVCAVCGKSFNMSNEESLLEQTAFQIDQTGWEPPDDLCQACRESRGLLAMMYVVDR